MKRFAKIFVVLGFLYAYAHAGLEPGQLQITVNSWLRYKAGTAPFENYLAIERGYLRLDCQLTEKIKSRVNLDVFSSDKEDYPDGAGLKLKYAYLKFDEIIPEGKLTVGLHENYWGLIYTWGYPTIEKVLEEKEHVLKPADYGISFSQDFSEGLGEWQIGIYNGEGYTRTGYKVDPNPAISGNIRVIPIPGITFGGSTLYEDRRGARRLLTAGIGRVAFRPVDIWGEIIMTKIGKVTSIGGMIMPILTLASELELVGRLDYWNPDTEAEKDNRYRIIAGFNYYPVESGKDKPTMMIQMNWEGKKKDSELRHEFLVQLRWEFTSHAF